MVIFTDESASNSEEDLAPSTLESIWGFSSFLANNINWMKTKGHPLISLNRVNHPEVAALEHQKSQATVLHQLLTARTSHAIGVWDNPFSIFVCLCANVCTVVSFEVLRLSRYYYLVIVVHSFQFRRQTDPLKQDLQVILWVDLANVSAKWVVVTVSYSSIQSYTQM